jgi:hypothetical protein
VTEYYIDAEGDFWKLENGKWFFHDGPWRPDGYSTPTADGLPHPFDARVRHTDPEAQPLVRLYTEDELTS